ncbi:MAG: hypothetical protein CW342_13640 [Thermoactinomycetaceae bacterium]|nr:hypothetical protein [Thermoactinomycetaceae bacterium]
MREWGRGIRKRRQRRVRAIREGKPRFNGGMRWKYRDKEEMSGWDVSPWNRPGPWNEKTKHRKESRFLIQLFCSFLLLTFTYLIFQSDTAAGRKAQDFVAQVMERDFNFAGVAEWYESKFAGSPSILPVFKLKSEKDSRESVSWSAPLQGDVIRPFSRDGRGIVIAASGPGPVTASAEGLVVFAGEREGLGKTVIVRHPGGKETWYGWLDKIRVRADDWVKKGQTIASIGERSGRSLLYFALRVNDRFVDPGDVIPLE